MANANDKVFLLALMGLGLGVAFLAFTKPKQQTTQFIRPKTTSGCRSCPQ